ncbi:hypothetical protein Tco_1540393 [Tanacetum coccineum]
MSSEVYRKDEVENKTYDEPVRSTKRDLMGEKVRELVETRKMDCESYHLLPIEPMRKAMLKKMITKKEDIKGRKVHLVEDKQTPSVGVFDEVIWEALGGYTRDLDSFGEETEQDCSFTMKWLQELLIEPRDGIAIF